MRQPYRNRHLVFALLLTLAASCTSFKKPPSELPPDYRDAPLYYEMLDAQQYHDPENLELMLADSVTLTPIGTERIEDFNWASHKRRDLSWWVRMERFEYLAPLIASRDPRHREFARDWVEGFLDAHEVNPHPNMGSRDAMAIGIRVLVLAWYLKILTEEDPDDPLIERIKNHVRWTQTYLADPIHFSTTSNHGFWESLGLFETTRVLPDSQLTHTALKRVYQIVRTSVSDLGFHREHSPAYHFYFHRWLANAVLYFSLLDELAWDKRTELKETERKMREAAYYLYDHHMRMPPIGDSSHDAVADRYVDASRRSRADAVYDPEAGYAIFKDPKRSAFRRYVVFNNQNDQFKPAMTWHFHDDVLSVFYSDDGEIILGDQGRYSYTVSRTRTYLRSPSAHNTVSPRRQLGGNPSGSVWLAGETWWDQEAAQEVFGAASHDGKVRRRVVIPRSEPGITVLDSLVAAPPQVMLWNIGPDVDRFEQLPPRAVDGASIYTWDMTTHTGRAFLLTITIVGRHRTKQTTFFGQKDPMLGWYSPGYNVIVPVHVVKLDINPLGDVLVSTNVVDVSQGNSSAGRR